MFYKIFFLLLLSLELLASDTILRSNYYVKSDAVYLSLIIPHAQPDVQLFSINTNRYTKKVKSSQLILLLKQYGYDNYIAKSNYIKFTKESPIDSSKLKKMINDYYKKKYETIDIKQINISPRGYITSLPDTYTIIFQSKSHLSNSGTFYIKNKNNQKIFFDYDIRANVDVYVANKNIKRDVELSLLNTTKKSIILNKFRDMPLQCLQIGTSQTKKQIKKESVITLRDIERLNVIKKDSNVNVSLNSEGMAISLSAKALQDGKLHDIITVQQSNDKKLKVIVTGKNTAEIR